MLNSFDWLLDECRQDNVEAFVVEGYEVETANGCSAVDCSEM